MKLKFKGEFANELFLGKDKFLLKTGSIVDVDEKALAEDKGLFKFFFDNGTLEEVVEEFKEEVKAEPVAEEVAEEVKEEPEEVKAEPKKGKKK